MKLRFSKSWFFGLIYALSIGFILLMFSGVFFFDIMIAHPGSDFFNNSQSIIEASNGSYWSGKNTPTSVSQYLFNLHFYYWLKILNSFIQNNASLLRVITLFITFMFICPTLFSAAQLKNKRLLFALLFVLFMHPRFMDLVIGNIRSASALALVFCSLWVKGTKLKFLLMGVAVTFHLGSVAPIFLHLIHLFWKRLPKRFSRSDLLVWVPLLAPSVVIIAAKVIFGEGFYTFWKGGLVYTSILFIICAYTFFIGKRKVNNEFVFVSLGLISLVIWGALLGFSTMRFFSFFIPFFAVMMLHYDRNPQVLISTFILWLLFTIAAHSKWILIL